MSQSLSGNHSFAQAVNSGASFVPLINKIRHAGRPQAVSLQQLDYQLSQKQLLNKLNDAASKTNQPSDNRSDKKPLVDQTNALRLSETCRLIVINQEGAANNFNMSLQVAVDAAWVTIVSYEYRLGKGYRYIHYRRNAGECFPLDLPAQVVLEMAREDLKRNWQTYAQEFSARKVTF